MGPDGDADGEADTAADADDADDAEGVGDDDADADADAGVCLGGWFDPSSDLCWQDPPDETLRNWEDALAYCDGLSLGGRDDWHLPTISELRSFVRGCPGTVTGGECGATDSCLDYWSCASSACNDCSAAGGSAAGGCYWDVGVGGRCSWYWSSSHAGDFFSAEWVVGFYGGYVTVFDRIEGYYVRCVRPGP